MADIEKVIKGLECEEYTEYARCNQCPYVEFHKCKTLLIRDALALLKEQDEVITALLEVGYPHNFQREEPWIRNYMYAITDVIKKAFEVKA